MRTDRTYKLGRLAELQDKIQSLRIQTHAYVTALLAHFDPFDIELEYVERIKPLQIETWVKGIIKHVDEIRKLRSEVEALKEDLGQD